MGAIGLAACGGHGTDIEPTLVFAERSDDEISRLIIAATGEEQTAALSFLALQMDGRDPGCPVVAETSDTITVTGDCTRVGGAQIVGSAIIRRPSSEGLRTYHELRRFGYVGASSRTTYDGFVDRRDDLRTWDGDVTVDQDGLAVRADIYSRCETSDERTTCSHDGSGVELVGVGGAHVSGTTTVGLTAYYADYVLRGVDRLVVTLPGGPNGCIGWNIEGTDRHHDCPR